MTKEDVDFLIKLRDAAAMVLDACNERLESLAPPGASPAGSSYDVTKIAWQRAEGPKGIYMKTEGDNTPDYQALLKDLQAHKGRLTVEGSFFWLFEDGRTIGRKVKT